MELPSCFASSAAVAKKPENPPPTIATFNDPNDYITTEKITRKRRSFLYVDDENNLPAINMSKTDKSHKALFAQNQSTKN